MSGKRRVKVSGGRAGYNFVSFTGEKYQTLSQFKNGRITTETKLNKEDKKITIILSKIPFVRSFSMVFDLLIEYWRRFIVAAIVLILMELLFIGRSNSIFLYTIPINNLEMLLGLLVIAGLFIKVSEIGSYHAAEHMTSNAFDSGLNLTLDNVRQQPRVHKDCGTNQAVSIVLCFSVLSLILEDSVYVFLLAWSIGYELWRGEPKVIWSLILVIGKVTQYLLFTSKPQDKHLKVAIEAMTRLEEKELAN
ncbi:hypothetical protein B5V88_07095 [Heyndrickxia sporothermodurans]|uniref:DUF1385 domain-containing protein n=1 Tax=Heyndrickxia sporothermodurans TaxID=46224 RepID=A0AB37HND2_9BACI|nr:DUF1385 domain-containing protein [Heyndrickxia sporothermodurans]MBL5767361.1 DUF1385 domain-containing protein [Heyndrickxia sporothermodurans]MBL5770834.1 DUF1385 domain-containing protein [Heyndrickxia sporothermodurans]MBL5774474.1 DUF1385 domain-containing protein [Heyndrickxia sporothermodurans]MBL5779562.1 DUF1385 domain-containing protein [Heyndrickxia sporothermodurans]MBL5781561.1 DUF1385 domain-containing protein [Heyndrickxia sporothermodurans]